MVVHKHGVFVVRVRFSAARQYGPVAHLVRAPLWHSGGSRFEPDQVHWAFAAVVELVDTLASGANLRKEVGVQISPAAQLCYNIIIFIMI